MFKIKVLAVSLLIGSGLSISAIAADTSENISMVTASSIDKNNKPEALSNNFAMGQQVYAYLTVNGKPESQPKQLEAKWYHCGKQVAAHPYTSKPFKDPHHVWFWINSKELGAGSSRVDVLSGETLLGRSNFSVRNSSGQDVECPKPVVPKAVKPLKSISLAADALFAFGKSSVSDITAKGQTELRNAISQINEAYSKVNSITVVGHTDSIGNDAKNMELSVARANAIRSLLINNGIPANIISAEGRGETENVTSCDPKLPRQAAIYCKAPDRRVNLVINGVERQVPVEE